VWRDRSPAVRERTLVRAPAGFVGSTSRMEHSKDDYASVRDDETDDDTSGGPLSHGAGEGSGQGADGAPDVDVAGGADDEGGATDDAVGGGGGKFEGGD
jgi:hypothetical protein